MYKTQPYGYSRPRRLLLLLLLFVTHLAQRIKPQSIKVYLAGIRALHISNGFASPLTNTIKLNQTLRGIDREHSTPITQKLPITFDLLCQLYVFINFSDIDNIVYWSAMTLAHFLLLRAGEFVVTDPSQTILSINDIEIKLTKDNQEYIALNIRKSKTDQANHGIRLYTGHTNHKVCAVCAMKANLRVQHQHSTATTSPLFRLSTGVAMSRIDLKNFLSALLRLINIPCDRYSTHSFRIGGATSAAVAGLKDYEIKMLGRWTSDCYKRYIRSPISMFLHISQQISTTANTAYQYANPYSPPQ